MKKDEANSKQKLLEYFYKMAHDIKEIPNHGKTFYEIKDDLKMDWEVSDFYISEFVEIGYIEMFKSDPTLNNHDTYGISDKGKVFYYSGGFSLKYKIQEKEREKNNLEKKMKIITIISVIILTLIATVTFILNLLTTQNNEDKIRELEEWKKEITLKES